MFGQKRSHNVSLFEDSKLPGQVHRWSHQYSILSIVSFPNKNILVAGTQDSKILIFDLLTYNLSQTIELGLNNSLTETNTRSSVLCMTKSADKNYLFTAGSDSLVRVWAIGQVKNGSIPPVTELAIIYSVSDIGDIFSIRYFDSIDTVMIGCQNASLLFLDNLFERIKDCSKITDNNFEKLPHKRFDKFFDSIGPTGQKSVTSSNNKNDQGYFSQEGTISPLQRSNSCILEIPSNNTIPYAHNSFIYSIVVIDERENMNRIEQEHIKTVHIITGGGDGISKCWSIIKERETIVIKLLSDSMDNDDSILSQSIEYPFLYCGLSDGIIKIWDLNTKQLVSTLKTEHDSDIISISAYEDHIYAINESGISHFYENKIQTWYPNQGKVLCSDLFERRAHNPAKSVFLATGGNDGSLAIWDLSYELDINMNAISKHIEYQSKNRSCSFAFVKPAILSNELMIESLRELISFQTVSQNADTTQQLASRRCATFLKQLFADFGAINVQLLPIKNGDNPVVFAEFEANAPTKDKKKILWYGHYDVVSPGDPSLWSTNPFNLTCENGYMIGRGVTDNKGPLIASIYTVASLFQEKKLVNDVVFLIEGSEEIGSPGLKDVCIQYIDLIGPKIDWIILSNSSWVDESHPCLNYGLRGVINAEVTINSDGPNKHSGIDGGVYSEPTSELIGIISKLQDNSSYITIPGFYDNINELSEEEKTRFEKVLKFSSLHKNLDIDDLIANWTKPSLSITSLNTSGAGNITVISKSVSIGLSIRLVPGQDVDDVKSKLINYLETLFNESKSKNHFNVRIVNEASVWLGDPKNNAYQILKEEVTKAWEVEPLFVREGGSIPCIRFLEQIFDAPAVQIPCGQSTGNSHLENENLRIINFSKLTNILANVFNRL